MVYGLTIMNKDQLYVERRPQGDYAVRRPGSERASAVEPTQAKAIERAKEIQPRSTPMVRNGSGIRMSGIRTSGGRPEDRRQRLVIALKGRVRELRRLQALISPSPPSIACTNN